MPKSIFDREVFFKMEQMDNPFIAARALSKRARDVNAKLKEKEVETEEKAASISAPALALDEYLEGRITFPMDYQTNSHEE
jgi:hypothetical protein